MRSRVGPSILPDLAYHTNPDPTSKLFVTKNVLYYFKTQIIIYCTYHFFYFGKERRTLHVRTKVNFWRERKNLCTIYSHILIKAYQTIPITSRSNLMQRYPLSFNASWKCSKKNKSNSLPRIFLWFWRRGSSALPACLRHNPSLPTPKTQLGIALIQRFFLSVFSLFTCTLLTIIK